MRRRPQLLILVVAAGVLLAALPPPLLAQVQLAVSSISPSRAFAGSPGFNLAVYGTGFVDNATAFPQLRSVVLWNGQALSTTYWSSTLLTAAVPATLLTAVSTANVRVWNPTPNQSSNTVTFSILTPLSITTPALTAGTVGGAYSQQLTGVGGTQPYWWDWSPATGSLPPGLSLNNDNDTGVISGIPTFPGTYSILVRLYDRYENLATKTFTLIVVAGGTSEGPPGMVGQQYQATLRALAGQAPYTWTILSGALPPGLGLDRRTGVISGEPTLAGTFLFTVQWADVQGLQGFPTQHSIRIYPQLEITTASLSAGVVGEQYPPRAIVATGGNPPYTWSASGGLPPGLSLSQSGTLGGTPTQAGAYNFTVSVTDSRQASATKAFAVTVSVPQAPALSVTGLTDIVSPAQQPSLDVQLSSTYALAITGTITLTFTPDAVAPSNDPSIQFSSGGRTLSFTIPAGPTRAFPTSPPAIQTGTVAGRIDLTLHFSAGGQDITPSPAPVRSVQIARSAPTITSVQVVNKTSSGFTVRVTGYSTPRQVTQAVFTFTPSSGGNLGTTQLTVPVDAAFTTWFTGTASGQFGSSFLYTQPFQVQGALTDIASVSVTLSNSAGTSQPASASF